MKRDNEPNYSKRKANFGDEIELHREKRTKFNLEEGPNDPMWKNMWYVNPLYELPLRRRADIINIVNTYVKQ